MILYPVPLRTRDGIDSIVGHQIQIEGTVLILRDGGGNLRVY